MVRYVSGFSVNTGHLRMEEQLRKVTANPPVPGGGLPLPSRSQQMVDETGFPRGKGSRNCPTFCSFSQPCTSPSWPVPAQKSLGDTPWLWLSPSGWDAQGQPSWTRASTGSLGSLQRNSAGLGKNSQAMSPRFSLCELPGEEGW